mmetsp:Transcript_15120/g.12837  ORF Transcript_15120/g.12837 Transcript_15120/m.12837 type:complete len:173 (-) Transcript_15120:151-669(-)|eukprot:CAMPEP_0114590792 /NCGR_PEP_ID=MMETSP0125-20121206/12981_1 /TAXON_ID=485358 ORGANISM="Aristerostoma sp., Strain ATCC 50986" /NCGR_SAMPLE_ID=MMETSP0125 /ASSEMBLY_ACC=CAM_ASM_000245 /LENGTH=172 /DNA_ID=CAMNT_0001788515 /DNA_START=224 /DNA_END=742 /DNA_ORIENTATION=-
MYKKKQLLGKIRPEEVKEYKKFDAGIEDALDKTLSAKTYIPWKGLLAGAGLNVFATMFNIPWSYRLGIFSLTLLFDYGFDYYNPTYRMKTLAFLDWSVKYRTARAIYELDAPKIDQKLKRRFQSTIGNVDAESLFDSLTGKVNEDGCEPLFNDNVLLGDEHNDTPEKAAQAN